MNVNYGTRIREEKLLQLLDDEIDAAWTSYTKLRGLRLERREHPCAGKLTGHLEMRHVKSSTGERSVMVDGPEGPTARELHGWMLSRCLCCDAWIVNTYSATPVALLTHREGLEWAGSPF